jgi:CRISPR/Cas system-associated exonuclease Cas4 (RecB family)
VELPTVSATRIKTFASCPRKYYYQYVKKLPSVRHPAATMGTAVHRAIDSVYKDPTAQPLNVYNGTWLEEFRQYPELLEHAQSSRLQMDGQKILGKYDFAARIPRETEVEFRLPYPDPIEPICLVHGFVDQIYADGTLVDLKTSRNKPIPAVLSFDPQFVLYAWAYLNMYGEVLTRGLWHHLRTSEDIEAVGIQQKPNFEYVLRIVEDLLRTMDSVVEGEDDPTLFTQRIGDPCMFCSFRQPCLQPEASQSLIVDVPLAKKEAAG